MSCLSSYKIVGGRFKFDSTIYEKTTVEEIAHSKLQTVDSCPEKSQRGPSAEQERREKFLPETVFADQSVVHTGPSADFYVFLICYTHNGGMNAICVKYTRTRKSLTKLDPSTKLPANLCAKADTYFSKIGLGVIQAQTKAIVAQNNAIVVPLQVHHRRVAEYHNCTRDKTRQRQERERSSNSTGNSRPERGANN